ncbi:MAG: hypothetical protein M3R36_07865 [Bacteroidota bacterium]|nr:hypothetical protein [Bacteroidota bacterium]
MNPIKYLFFFTIFYFSINFSGCEIEEPAAPSWDVDLNVPIANKTYNILDILDRSSNIGFDSLNNDLVFLYGESNYKRKFGKDIKFDGITTTNVIAPSTTRLDTFLIFDDSTFVTRTEFLNGVLNFTFFNPSNENYSFNLTIKNLYSVSNNDTARISGDVSPGLPRSMDFNLAEYYVKNDIPENTFKLRLNFVSANPVAVNFNYSLSGYSIKTIEGRIKPLNTGITNEEVIDPFGSDVPEGELNFASITPNKNFFVVKKFSNIYQVDLKRISIVGENKNGRRVRLKYLRNGNSGDPVDSIFSLTLPSDRDSLSFPLNENNSNILEFINNIPKKIELKRNDFLNLPYNIGRVSNTDSLTFKLMIQVPLDVSIDKPIVFSDTVDVGIDDEDQRKNLDDAKNLVFTLKTINALPLKAVVKVLLLDSLFRPLIAISKIIGNQADSTISAHAAPVGIDGFVNNSNTTSFSSELDSIHIQKIKHIGKIIYEYKLFTDPNQISPPNTTVKIKATDIVRGICFGTLKYRISPD